MRNTFRRRLALTAAALLAGSTLAATGAVIPAGADEGQPAPTEAAATSTETPGAPAPDPEPASEPSTPTPAEASEPPPSEEPPAETPVAEPPSEEPQPAEQPEDKGDNAPVEDEPVVEEPAEPEAQNDIFPVTVPQAAGEQLQGALAAAAPDDCPRPGGPADLSSALLPANGGSVKLTDTDGVEIGPDNTVLAWDHLRLEFLGKLPEGGCEGDTVTIGTPPSGLTAFNGTYDIRDGDGVLMGRMVVVAGVATLTFNDYIESHENVEFSGHLAIQVNTYFAPGGEYEVNWPIGDSTMPIPVNTGPCVGTCGNPTLGAHKNAWYETGDPDDLVHSNIVTRESGTAGEQITITDRLGPGQEFMCGWYELRIGRGRDAWGSVVWEESVKGRADVTYDCQPTTTVVTLTAPAAGEYYSLVVHAKVTDYTLDKYTDEGEVDQNGKGEDFLAVAEVHDGGVSGSGNGRSPKIDIEKWSKTQAGTDGGPVVHTPHSEESGAGFPGDFDIEPGKELEPDADETISFTVKNTGNEHLKDVVVSDELTGGVGAITGLTCTFPVLDGQTSTATTWSGPFRVDESFTCTGTLPALGFDAKHADLAKVSATGWKTNKDVGDEDPWHANTPPKPKPSIDVEKWSTADGGPVVHTPHGDESGPGFPGDFDITPGKEVDPDQPEAISFTVKNTGEEPLLDVVVIDETTVGDAVIADLTCAFPVLDGQTSTATTWSGPFQVGDSFTCTGTLPALGAGAAHTDNVKVNAIGEKSKTPVDDEDPWNGFTPEAPTPSASPSVSESPTPTTTPTPTPTPTVSASVTESPTPTNPPSDTNPPSGNGVLPNTGAGSALLGLTLLGGLLLVGGLLMTRRSRGSHS